MKPKQSMPLSFCVRRKRPVSAMLQLLTAPNQTLPHMPIIENMDPTKVETKLQPNFPKLIDAFLRLSPHSKKVAEEIMARRKLQFELDAETNDFLYAAAAMPVEKELIRQRICIGLRAIERTWAGLFG